MKFNLEGLSLEEALYIIQTNTQKLDFDNNFEGFEKDIVISANSTVTITNNLTFTPSRYIILSQEGNGLVTKTGTWSKDFVYLKNNGSDQVTIKVVFLK